MNDATEELRRLLDERGVEYETYIERPTGFEHVKWNFNEHGSADFNLEFGEPWLTMYGVISDPEQAIAATLGADAKPTQAESSGTCEYCKGRGFDGQIVMMSNHGWQRINYCPNCGRKVVDE